MSTTLDPTSTPPSAPGLPAGAAATHPARRLLVTAALTGVAADIGWMIAVGEAVPPMLGFGLLIVLAATLLRRRPRAQAIVLAVLAVLFLAVGGRFVVGELGHPSDLAAFAWAVLTGGGRTVTLAAAAMVLRDRPGLVRPVGAVAAVVVAGAVGYSAVVSAAVESDARREGDVAAPIAASEFPEVVTVDAGSAVFVENQDRIRHTFTVEAAGIDVNLPPGIDRRIAVDAAPGRYAIRCTVPGHEAMTGTLVVE